MKLCSDAGFLGQYASGAGNYRLNQRTWIRQSQAKFSAEFFRSLTHPTDTDADAAWLLLHHAVCNSASIVAHPRNDLRALEVDRYPGLMSVRMAEHVAQ